MGIDLKYLVVSITAIFISLGIGVLIGTNMNGQGFISEQQQLLVKSIEDKLLEYDIEHESLTRTNENLKKEIEKKDYYINTFYGKMTNGKLANLNVVVLQMDEFNTDYIEETVYGAGGNVSGIVALNSKLLNLTQDELEEFNKLFHNDLSYEKLINKLSVELIDYILSGKKTDLIEYAISKDYINSNFLDEKVTPVDKIIITGGLVGQNKNINKKIVNDILKVCKDKYVNVVGVETSDVKQSIIPLFINNNISTVDNVDSLLGRLSLVLVLSGIEGNFGETEHAHDLLPIGN